MIRTAPSRMAMLTESREAMSRKSPQITGFASLSSPHFDANPIRSDRVEMPGFSGMDRRTGMS